MIARLRAGAVKIIRSGERFAKTDMAYLVRGGAWLSVANVVLIALSFASTVAFANLLPKTAYGTFQYALSVIDLLAVLALPGIDTAISRSVARGKDGSFATAVWTKIRWSAAASAAAAVVAAYYLLNGNTLLGGSMLIGAAAIPLFENLGSYVSLLQGKRRFDLLTVYEIGAQAISTASVVAALLLTDNVLIILAVYFVSWIAARALFLRATLRRIERNDIADPELIPYGKHLTVMNVAATVSSNIDKILLWHYLGPVEVAMYTFSLGMPLRIVGSFKIVNRLAFPKMANQDRSTLRRTLLPKILMLALAASATAIAYIVAAPYLFALLLPQYMEAVPYSRLAAALIALQPFSLISSSLTAHARTRALYFFNAAVPVLRIALFVALIPAYHLAGALGALVAAKACESVVLLWIFLRERPANQNLASVA